jgi:hypothetical protein
VSQGVKITLKQKMRFLAALRESPNVKAACAAANVGRSAIYALEREDKEFSEAWHDALGESIDDLHGIAIDLARHGSVEPVVSGGKLIFRPGTNDPWTITRHPIALMMRLLEAHLPEKFSRKVEAQQVLPLDLQPDPKPIPDEEVPEIIE